MLKYLVITIRTGLGDNFGLGLQEAIQRPVPQYHQSKAGHEGVAIRWRVESQEDRGQAQKASQHAGDRVGPPDRDVQSVLHQE